METLTLQEGAKLELLGAERRLQRAKEEYEYFLAAHSNLASPECQRDLHLLRIELDEARRQVAHAEAVMGSYPALRLCWNWRSMAGDRRSPEAKNQVATSKLKKWGSNKAEHTDIPNLLPR